MVDDNGDEVLHVWRERVCPFHLLNDHRQGIAWYESEINEQQNRQQIKQVAEWSKDEQV